MRRHLTDVETYYWDVRDKQPKPPARTK
jgi:hypothetical protein